MSQSCYRFVNIKDFSSVWSEFLVKMYLLDKKKQLQILIRLEAALGLCMNHALFQEPFQR